MLWSGIVISLSLFLGMTLFIPTNAESNSKFSLLLNCAGIVPLGLSLLLKSQILSKAAQQQQIDQVQVGYVLGFALTEAAALLAVVDHFVNSGKYFYVGFVFAGLGMLLHFPQKRHLLAAAGQEF